MKLAQGVAAALVVFATGVSVRSNTATAVTPIEKVIELLKQLSADVEKEGKAEAAQYDKYSCFCKEQADNKLYAIEKSTEKITNLAAQIEELNAKIADHARAIAKLGADIETRASDIANRTSTRKAEHEQYVIADANVSAAIDACERALTALKESKASFGGKAQLEALAQLNVVTERTLGVSLQYEHEGPYTSTYHSNDIIAVIEDLRKQFIARKGDLDDQEFETNSMFEKKRLDLQNENKFALEEKTNKEAAHAKMTAEKEDNEGDKLAETNANQSDSNFLNVLTNDCESKAKIFDGRSKTRAAELTALGEAIEALRTKVTPNWGANRKLVDLQKLSMLRSNRTQAPIARHSATSFLQLRRGGRDRDGVRKMLAFLSGAASRLGSSTLSALALKVRVSEDHFVKVRGIIKDLVAKLEADKMNEATRKEYCDKNMQENVNQRDDAASNLEKHDAQLSRLSAEEAKLTSEIATLQAQIAANAKALNENTELRMAEKADNEKVIADAGVGKAGVEEALNILKKFYDEQGALFAQYVPPDSDRSGQTVADLSPEIFDEDYKGKQKESKGVIGLLEIILSDFDRTDTTVREQEALSDEDFTDFKRETDLDTAAKEAEVKDKSERLTQVKDSTVEETDGRKTTAESHQNALDALESLKKMCVDGEETYAERVAAREKEIEALKEALQILRDWKD